MLSRLSFLSALNSGCRNSHAYCSVSLSAGKLSDVGKDVGVTYVASIWCLAALFIMSDLVKVVFI